MRAVAILSATLAGCASHPEIRHEPVTVPSVAKADPIPTAIVAHFRVPRLPLNAQWVDSLITLTECQSVIEKANERLDRIREASQ